MWGRSGYSVQVITLAVTKRACITYCDTDKRLLLRARDVPLPSTPSDGLRRKSHREAQEQHNSPSMRDREQ
jgi:hypothetical protein